VILNILSRMGDASEWSDLPGYGLTPGRQLPPPVAIVGMGVRLPGGVNSPSSLWDLLIQKRNGRCKVPASRYNVDSFYKPSKTTGSVASQYGYFIQDDIDSFDASFFSMSKAEVERLDPQQRLLLEVVWECMESGGQKDWRGGNVGCYVGVFGDVSCRNSIPVCLLICCRIGSTWEQKTRRMRDFFESRVPSPWEPATASVTSST
jgi:hypothetical protein